MSIVLTSCAGCVRLARAIGRVGRFLRLPLSIAACGVRAAAHVACGTVVRQCRANGVRPPDARLAARSVAAALVRARSTARAAHRSRLRVTARSASLALRVANLKCARRTDIAGELADLFAARGAERADTGAAAAAARTYLTRRAGTAKLACGLAGLILILIARITEQLLCSASAAVALGAARAFTVCTFLCLTFHILTVQAHSVVRAFAVRAAPLVL